MRLSILLLSLLVGRAAAQVSICSVCGEGLAVTNFAEIINTGSQNFTCAQLEGFGSNGQIGASDCAQLLPLVQASCGCEDAPTASPTITPVPTPSPTIQPTFGPPPECYTDLDELFERELRVKDTDVPRTYILCAETVFVLGRNNENGPGFIGGFGPFSPRSNARYQCGESGSSSNNCVLTDGSFQIVSFGMSFSEPQANVVFQGITFEAGYQGSMILANPGSITFDDCIIRNHQNIGPVLILFDTRFARRLKETSSGDHFQDVQTITKMIGAGEYENHIRKLHDEEDEELSRNLQVENPDIILELVVTFKNCLFENNIGVPLDGQVVRPGIITAQFPENYLEFDNCMIRNNDYGTPSVQPTGWAISTEGPIKIFNTCFVDNNFIREAPILVFDGQPVEVSGNYGTEDNGVACNFLAEFPDNNALESLANFTCNDYDSDVCLATVFNPVEPTSPTRPVRPTEAPVMIPPTMAPVVTVDEPSAADVPRVFSSMLLGVVGLFVGTYLLS